MSGVRSTRRWQLLCRSLIPKATHCALCGGPLLHGAPARSRWSPSLDHIVPISLGGAPFDVENLRAVHYRCNASRGNGTRRPLATRYPGPRVTSRDWGPPRSNPDLWMGAR